MYQRHGGPYNEPSERPSVQLCGLCRAERVAVIRFAEMANMDWIRMIIGGMLHVVCAAQRKKRHMTINAQNLEPYQMTKKK